MANATTTSRLESVADVRAHDTGTRPPPGPGGAKPVAGGTGGGFFEPYKRDQGAKVRGYSMVAASLLAAGAGKFIYERVKSWRNDAQPWTLVLVFGLPLLVALSLALAAFYLTYRKRESSDFLIATEGEMRKVNWSSRREVLGSTKVVIAFTLLFAFLMGFVDLLFFRAFQWMRVLDEGVSGLGDPGG